MARRDKFGRRNPYVLTSARIEVDFGDPLAAEVASQQLAHDVVRVRAQQMHEGHRVTLARQGESVECGFEPPFLVKFFVGM